MEEARLRNAFEYIVDYKEELEFRLNIHDKIVNLMRKGEENSSELNSLIREAHLRSQDVDRLREIAKEEDNAKRHLQQERFLTLIFARKKFHSLSSEAKLLFCTVLENNKGIKYSNVQEAMRELVNSKRVGRYSRVLVNEVESLLNALDALSYDDELVQMILREYDELVVKPSMTAGSKDNSRKDMPVIEEPTRTSVNVAQILRDCRDRFAELNKEIREDSNYLDIVNELLEKKILPDSPEGLKMIQDKGLDEGKIIEYFGLLNRITIALSINNNQDELIRFIRGLTDCEYQFIADMEAEGLTLEDPEGEQMLSERTIDNEKIRKFYEYLKGASLKDKKDVFETKDEQLARLFATLNSYEKQLVEDMIAEDLTPKDQEGMRMISERCVDPNHIIEYFNLRNNLDIDIRDAEEVEKSKKKDDKKSDSGSTGDDHTGGPADDDETKTGDHVDGPTDDDEDTKDDDHVGGPTEDDETKEDSKKDKGKKEEEKDESGKHFPVRHKERFFTRLKKFFGRIFGRKTRTVSDDFEKSDYWKRLAGFKMRNLDHLDDELLRRNARHGEDIPFPYTPEDRLSSGRRGR